MLILPLFYVFLGKTSSDLVKTDSDFVEINRHFVLSDSDFVDFFPCRFSRLLIIYKSLRRVGMFKKRLLSRKSPLLYLILF